VAGKKIQVIVKDDGAIADNSKRLAQELIVNEKVNFVVGFGVTPTAFAVAPLATEAKIPQIVMAAGTSSITERSPYVVRTSFTLAQSCVIMAEWALKNGIKKVVSMVSDFAPGIDSENFFKETFIKGGGEIAEFIRTPLPIRTSRRSCSAPAMPSRMPSSSSYRPARAPSSCASSSSAASTGGIKIIGPGDVTDDDVLNGMGDQVIGTVTAHTYSAYHPSAMNKEYVAAMAKANNGLRANFMSVAVMTVCT